MLYKLEVYKEDANGTVIQRRKFDSAKCMVNGVLTPGCKLYDGLTVWGEKGIKESVSASQYGAEKLAGFTIYNIPTGNAITFEVTTSYDYYTGNLTGSGETIIENVTLTETSVHTMTVSFDANGAYIK